MTVLAFPYVFDQRPYGKANFRYHWDASSQTIARRYSAELGYKLDKDGNPSISLEYLKGNTKEELDEVDVFKVNLNFVH